jgi:hypothetical protein
LKPPPAGPGIEGANNHSIPTPLKLFGLDLIEAEKPGPMLLRQIDALAEKVTWAVTQIVLDELADVRPQCRPEMRITGRNDEFSH